MKICIHCGDEFDLSAPAKIKAGGKVTECPQCSEETVVKYAGVQAADGKQTQATILKFDSEQDKNNYIGFWKAASGYNVGKQCQLSKNTPTTPGISFLTISVFNPTNHKGKAI